MTVDLDISLFQFTRSQNLRYSRYADDITVSGDFNENEIIKNLKRIIKEHGFEINRSKTTVKKQHQRQMVTGIVVNEKLSIKKADLRDLRQNIYYVKKHGLSEHLQRKQISKGNYLYHLLGKANYYLSVRKTDKNLLNYKAEIYKLIKQYY